MSKELHALVIGGVNFIKKVVWNMLRGNGASRPGSMRVKYYTKWKVGISLGRRGFKPRKYEG